MCILILFAAPACIGGLFVTKDGRFSAGTLFLAGFFVQLVAFELICAPLVLFTSGGNFKYLVFIYTPALLALCVAGVLRVRKTGVAGKLFGSVRDEINTMSRDTRIFWGVAAVILILILVLMETRVIFDGDDAYYVSQSVTAWQSGSMYSTNPYNGRAAAVDLRHAMATFTMWIAYVSRICGIHPAVMAHTVLPLLFVPMVLLTSAEIGALLLDGKRDILPVFVIFAEIMILFGRVSIYTAESFLTARIWQGKALAAGLLIPSVFLAYILLYREDDKVYRREEWILLAVINATAGIFSSLAVELVSVLIFTGGVLLGLKERKLRTFMLSAVCCLPGIIYMVIYLYFALLAWR